jgi:signal transduction histidine kinase
VTAAEAVGDVAAGTALVAAGVVMWARARDSRAGPLFALAGVAWLVGDTAGALIYAYRGPLAHGLLTFPSGRTRSKPIAALIAAVYLDGLIPAVAGRPLVTVALMTAVVGVAGWRWITARGVERRAHFVSAVCATLVGAPLVATAISRWTAYDIATPATWLFEAAVVVTAVGLAAELLSGSSVRAAATDLVIDLAGRQEPRALRDSVARTVGDPALEIAYRTDEAWVDESGQPFRLPVPGEQEGRVVSLVDGDDGAPVAALVHDPAVLRDRDLTRSVGAAVRLVMANVRLRAEEAARMREVTASRRRLVEAGDEQRRRLRQQLRAGAEQILVEVSRDLATIAASREGETRAELGKLAADLAAARRDLARFAQGVHPKALTDDGLCAALGELARQSAVPVSVNVPARRFPATVEAAAFFVCAEALTNVAKYADATAASIDVAAGDSQLLVRVADDGRGGADPTGGSGLRGLMDRVEALGGRFSIWSRAGAGTRVEVELPIAVSPP